MDLGVTVNRDAAGGLAPFTEVFAGFENVPTVQTTLGPETGNILSNLKADVRETGGYLYIDDEKGCVVVDRTYLREGAECDLYLDVVHELVHIRQLMEGQELFDGRYAYVDRPTEVEAYRTTVKEARRIGLDERQIADYLWVEWVSEHDFKRFLKTLGVGE
jgi:hypothetical protein